MNGKGACSAAVPPDVRKVSDLPRVSLFFLRGYAPNNREHCLPCDQVGRSPDNLSSACRKVRDLPHIGRQSREH